MLFTTALLKKQVPFNFSLDFLLDEQKAKTLHSREKRSNQKGMKEVFREAREARWNPKGLKELFREGPETTRTLLALVISLL